MGKAEAGRLGLGVAAQEGSQSVGQEWALTIPKTFRRGQEALEWQMRSTGPFEGLQG